jgi:nicotinate-nucleotide adenylyltransferase
MVPVDLPEALESIVELHLTPPRIAHSKGVARLSFDLCMRNGLEPKRGWLAGLCHDICREMPFPKQQFYTRVFERSPLGFRLTPGLLDKRIIHGPAAAGFLIAEFEIGDAEILESVARHTLGAAGMSSLACIVYAADKLESGRLNVDPAFRLRCMNLIPADLFMAVFSDSISWMKSRNKAIADESLVLYNSLVRAGTSQ